VAIGDIERFAESMQPNNNVRIWFGHSYCELLREKAIAKYQPFDARPTYLSN
jgi:hypothetical protein